MFEDKSKMISTNTSPPSKNTNQNCDNNIPRNPSPSTLHQNLLPQTRLLPKTNTSVTNHSIQTILNCKINTNITNGSIDDLVSCLLFYSLSNYSKLCLCLGWTTKRSYISGCVSYQK